MSGPSIYANIRAGLGTMLLHVPDPYTVTIISAQDSEFEIHTLDFSSVVCMQNGNCE